MHVIAAHIRSINPVGLYAECSTVSITVILVVYLLTNRSAELLGAIHAVIEDADGVLTLASRHGRRPRPSPGKPSGLEAARAVPWRSERLRGAVLE